MKKVPLFVGLGIIAVLALVALGVLLWPLAATQVQAAGSQSLTLQQPHTDCPRHGGRMMGAPLGGGGLDDCPMHAGEAGTDCPMQGGTDVCPQHGGADCPLHTDGGDCPMQGEECTGDCPLHTGGGDCPMQGGVEDCPMEGSMGVEGCPMEDGTVK